MLTEREIDATRQELQDFRQKSEKYLESHTEIVLKYQALVEDYSRLRSDYEEERDARERYKQLAKGQDRNPSVLVLVDGDAYIFDDELISDRTAGGSRAAQLLNDVVKNSLQAQGLDHCRIIVRVYANLSGLSKGLSQARLCGAEKRSFAPFTANFNRSNELFDFVDAGELKENADFKIRAVFRQFVENPQCKHIYFAACHDVGYISELMPYVNNTDRITLVRSHALHPEFSKLGLKIEAFPNVFRSNPLFSGATMTPAIQKTLASTDENTPVCTFFQRGQCKYGKGCRFLHSKASIEGPVLHSSPGNLSDSRDWRKDRSYDMSVPSFGTSHLNNSSDNVSSGNLDQSVPDLEQTRLEFATSLPRDDSIPSNQIPLNKFAHRLDPYMPPLAAKDYAMFKDRTSWQKLCNSLHLNGHCSDSSACQYDHSPITSEMHACLMQVAQSRPCPRRGGCRLLTCLYGHLCQTANCIGRGGKVYCRFPTAMHSVHLVVNTYVDGVTGNSFEVSYEGDEASTSISSGASEISG